jgi:hypothetical protein
MNTAPSGREVKSTFSGSRAIFRAFLPVSGDFPLDIVVIGHFLLSVDNLVGKRA